MSDLPWDMPGQTKRGFEPIRGAWVILRLLSDTRLGFTNIIHPAGIVGNLAGESGLTAIQEISPIAGRGGFGWEQATGSRRVEFEKFCAEKGWRTTDDLANYEFLVLELVGSESKALTQLKKTTTLEAATYTFEVLFERPSSTSDVNSRIKFAQQALDAVGSVTNVVSNGGNINIPDIPIPPPPEGTPVTVKVGTANVLDSTIRLLQDVLTIAGYYTGPIDGRPNDGVVEGLQKYLDWLDQNTGGV